MYNNLNQKNFVLQQQIVFYSEKLPIYRTLESYGIGHLELQTILQIITGISSSNGIPYRLAIDKLLSDLSAQYDSKLGFESQIEKLESDVQTLSELKFSMLNE